jgi:hypothetical protein
LNIKLVLCGEVINGDSGVGHIPRGNGFIGDRISLERAQKFPAAAKLGGARKKTPAASRRATVPGNP